MMISPTESSLGADMNGLTKLGLPTMFVHEQSQEEGLINIKQAYDTDHFSSTSAPLPLSYKIELFINSKRLPMSLIKWNRNFPAVPSFFDHFGLDDDFLANFLHSKTMPAVNISETDTTFLVEVAVPGMQKKDFHVIVEGGMLSISAEKETKTDKKEKNYRRQEYSYETFERSFRLPENVSSKEVKAKYENGLLKISLQKVAIEEPKKKAVEIA